MAERTIRFFNVLKRKRNAGDFVSENAINFTSEVEQTALTTSGFKLSWSTDLPSTTEVWYGTEPDLGFELSVQTSVTDHAIVLEDLAADIPLFESTEWGRDAAEVADQIERFDATGIQLASGEHLDADVVITATGFDLAVLGDIAFTVDGEPLVLSDTVTYRGIMFTGVPNMAWVYGYGFYSWTLRVELIGNFVCRLLGHLQHTGAKSMVPALRPEDVGMSLKPWVDTETLNPGYLLRS